MIYLLDYIENLEITDIKQITRKDILDYLNTFPKYYRKTTLKNYYKELRVILRFLYNKKYIIEDLSIIVPNIRVSVLETIPSFWNEEDIKQLFDNIDTTNTYGKRLYAILLLALRYGMRIGDIKELKFENIDWKNKRISFIQSKTKKELNFPLLQDVSDALIDYIKNGRPNSKEKFLFLTKDGKKLYFLYNFHDDIKDILEKLKLENNNLHKKGIHSLSYTNVGIILDIHSQLIILIGGFYLEKILHYYYLF